MLERNLRRSEVRRDQLFGMLHAGWHVLHGKAGQRPLRRGRQALFQLRARLFVRYRQRRLPDRMQPPELQRLLRERDLQHGYGPDVVRFGGWALHAVHTGPVLRERGVHQADAMRPHALRRLLPESGLCRR